MKNATFLSVNHQGIVVRLDKEGNTANIIITELSDNVQACEKIFKAFGAYKKSFGIGQVIITKIDEAKGTIFASRKYSLVNLGDQFPTSHSDLVLGDLYIGVVKNVTDHFCFVQIGSMIGVTSAHVGLWVQLN